MKQRDRRHGDGGLDCLERLLLGVGESPFEAILTPARGPMRLVCIRSAMHNFLLVVLITCLSVVIVGTVTLFAGMHGGQLNGTTSAIAIMDSNSAKSR
jgi:hypothetical protein